jgi:hypothetical protein
MASETTSTNERTPHYDAAGSHERPTTHERAATYERPATYDIGTFWFTRRETRHLGPSGDSAR